MWEQERADFMGMELGRPADCKLPEGTTVSAVWEGLLDI